MFTAQCDHITWNLRTHEAVGRPCLITLYRFSRITQLTRSTDLHNGRLVGIVSDTVRARDVGCKEVGIAGLVVEGVIPGLGVLDPQNVLVPAGIFREGVLRDVDDVLNTLGGCLPTVVLGHRPP